MNISSITDDININKSDCIVVGVSAGPDSMALLHILKNNSYNKIICAHINHNVRKESLEEAKYLKEYCEKFNITFEYTCIEKYTEANFENEARKKRYEFYEQVLNKYNSHYLFLAHHGDDLIETILMKIIRGSNLEGYAGIKKYSHVKNYTIIRPLLNVTKEDILNYNQENNIKYYIDKTNSDEHYTRNRYRLNIIPVLKQEDANIHQKFLNFSNTIQEYHNYIESVTLEKINIMYEFNKLDLTLFKKEKLLIQKNIIFNILKDIYENEANIIKEKHLLSIIYLIQDDKPNGYITLPKNYIAIKSYNIMSFELREQNTENYKFELTKNNQINNFIIKQVDTIDTNGNDVCKLNSQNIKLPLYIRNKKPGDYIEILGTNGKKKVSRVFIDNKIPVKERNKYPLVVDSNDLILWIPNLKKSKYIVKNTEFYDIILTSYKEREEHNEEKK